MGLGLMAADIGSLHACAADTAVVDAMQGLEHGPPTTAPSSSAPIFDQPGQNTSFFSY